MKLWRTPFDSSPALVPLGYATIDWDRCKGCGFCVEFCPREVLARPKFMSSALEISPSLKG